MNEITVEVGGFPIVMREDNPLIWEYSHRPDYNQNLGRLASAVKQKYPDMVALDCGANVGDTCAIIRQHANVPVICFEGDAENYGLLSKNIDQFNQVFCFQEWLGDHTESAGCAISKFGTNATLTKQGDAPPVETITLDDFLLHCESRVPFIKLLKTDCEGWDINILNGAVNLILSNHPVIFYEHSAENMHGAGDTKFLVELGYTKQLVYDNYGTPVSKRTAQSEPLCYYDVAVFHKDDEDLFTAFSEDELK